MAKKSTKRPSLQSTRADELRARLQTLRRQLQDINAGKSSGNDVRFPSSAALAKSSPAKGAKSTKARRSDSSGVPELTQRESQVLKLTVDEYVSREIAKKLKIGTRTVESHRASLMKKLGCKTIVGLTRYAIAKRIVPFEFAA